jgi:hypothetical protein
MSTMTVSAGLGRAGYGRASATPHLTRRGRLLVTTLTLLLLVTGGVLLSGGATALAGTDRAGAGGVTAQRVTVRPGDTLWQIAERAAPGTDPRETIARILDLNDLQTAQVQVGTALLLPPR